MKSAVVAILSEIGRSGGRSLIDILVLRICRPVNVILLFSLETVFFSGKCHSCGLKGENVKIKPKNGHFLMKNVKLFQRQKLQATEFVDR